MQIHLLLSLTRGSTIAPKRRRAHGICLYRFMLFASFNFFAAIQDTFLIQHCLPVVGRFRATANVTMFLARQVYNFSNGSDTTQQSTYLRNSIHLTIASSGTGRWFDPVHSSGHFTLFISSRTTEHSRRCRRSLCSLSSFLIFDG